MRAIQEMLRAIEVAYGLPDAVVEDELGGLSSENFLLRSGADRYVLKRLRVGNAARLHDRHVVLRALGARHAWIRPPVLTRDQESELALHDAVMALYPYVDGRVLPHTELTTTELASTAKTLAVLHDTTDASLERRLRPYRRRTPAAAREEADAVLAHARRSGVPHADTAVELIGLKLGWLPALHGLLESASLPTGLVHGDFHSQNVVFAPNGSVAAVLDFEDVGLGPRTFDVFTFVNLCCCNEGLDDGSVARAHGFLRPYLASQPLGQREFRLGLADFLYRMFSSFFLEKLVVVEGRQDVGPYLSRDLRKYGAIVEHLEAVAEKLYPAD